MRRKPFRSFEYLWNGTAVLEKSRMAVFYTYRYVRRRLEHDPSPAFAWKDRFARKRGPKTASRRRLSEGNMPPSRRLSATVIFDTGLSVSTHLDERPRKVKISLRGGCV